MSQRCARQLTFDHLNNLPVVVQPSTGQMSSDAGLLPVAEFDRRWKFTQRMADCLEDWRSDPDHSIMEMLRQRVFGILADYEDCNDHDDLRDDPVFKIVAERCPDEDPLASQPTLSRFENSITPVMLQRLIDFLVESGIERLQHHHGELPESITLDIDPTDDPTHGKQQLSLFHGYYKQHQYFPQLISEPTTRHVFLAWLRPGTVHASLGADEDLHRVVSKLRQAKPELAVHVRGDCGFGVPRMYTFCEENKLTYTFGLTSNPRLKRLAASLLQRAVDQYNKTGEKQRLFTRFEYQAETWERPRTVIAKAECQSQGTNLRFVITNLEIANDKAAEQAYDDYVKRGESEQRNDELKNGLSMDRLSCHRFMANFWRLLLHVAAYNLLNAFRDSQQLPHELQRAQPARWRTRVIKVAARVIQSTRRILIELSSSWPHWLDYRHASQRALTFSLGP